MTKQPATDHISGSIEKIEFKVKNGRVKPLRKKIKTEMTQGVSDDTAKLVNDMIKPVERKNINRKVRADYNPASGAHNIVADTKKKISDQVKDDLGL